MVVKYFIRSYWGHEKWKGMQWIRRLAIFKYLWMRLSTMPKDVQCLLFSQLSHQVSVGTNDKVFEMLAALPRIEFGPWCMS